MSSSNSVAAASAAVAQSVPLVMLSNGMQIPAIGFGTWRSPAGLVQTAVYEAIKCGYRHIDCARVYANEVEVGNGIAQAVKEGLVTRADLFITSKIWNNAHSPAQAEQNLTQTLTELQTSYVDLLLMHWPVNLKNDAALGMFPRDAAGNLILEEDSTVASIELCWKEMEKMVVSKRVKAIGVSNFTTAQLDSLLAYAKIRPVVNQVEIHPYFPQNSLIQYLGKQHIQQQAYCPLANLLNKGEEDITPLNEEVIKKIAAKYSKTPAQVILRWGLQHSGVILPKSTTPARIQENIQILDFQLNQEDMELIDQLGKKNKRFVNPPFKANGEKLFSE